MKKKALPIPGSDQPELSVFSVHLTRREECASKCNIPTVVRSKRYAKGDTLERASESVCPVFITGKKLGVFLIKLINIY